MKLANIFAIGSLCLTAYVSATPSSYQQQPAITPYIPNVPLALHSMCGEISSVCGAIQSLSAQNVHRIEEFSVQIVAVLSHYKTVFWSCQGFVKETIVYEFAITLVEIAKAYAFCETLAAGYLDEYETSVGEGLLNLILLFEFKASGFIALLRQQLLQIVQQGSSEVEVSSSASAAASSTGIVSSSTASAQAEASSSAQSFGPNGGSYALLILLDKMCYGSFKF
ncbi:hypothetical protein NEOLI_003049 [Neolecta irregularis DAH-3]|uniref:Uncharacterized protein n=1 Tax=Neolecta irregularis (strain DAH-3) TaxID=1198029 RepID=A0A1U7LPD2_NEOID|nr:hypothetical protein NEOLI_003049 [Neolecta irregularis DAH-3]|eukprot:OLL24381.1 hypothetical protein NEOLI_003049 [Neolecta irregularis DAH-3]